VLFADVDLGAEPRSLVEVARRLRATVLDVVPSLLSALNDDDLARLPARIVFCGGEQLPRSLVARFLQASAASLYNQYGPSEACIDSTSHHCGPEDALADTIPIGRAIAGARAYVLGPDGRRTPFGASGELCVGGAGVAVGYLGDPALTAERFVPDPFWGDGAARMYRTGDRVRWRSDGRLEFLGRLDSQVKIRGHRVEVEEVEAALRDLPAVRSAAVAVVGGTVRRLVAYVTVDAPTDPVGLRARLVDRLPSYMVPFEIRIVPEVPLNANGKLDRTALERMAAAHGAAPATEQISEGARAMTTVVAEAFARVLEMSSVGADDDLYQLGGASLGASLIASELSAALGREVSVRTVLENPRVGALAVRLAAAGSPVAPDAGSRPRPLDEPGREADAAEVAQAFEVRHQRALERASDGPAPPIVDRLPLPAEVLVADIARAVQLVAARHDALAPFGPASAPDRWEPCRVVERWSDAIGVPIPDGVPGMDVLVLDGRDGAAGGDVLLRAARNRADAQSLHVLGEEILHALGQGGPQLVGPAPSYRAYAAERHEAFRLQEAELTQQWSDALQGHGRRDIFSGRRQGARTWRGRAAAVEVPSQVLDAVERRVQDVPALPVVPYVMAFARLVAELTGESAGVMVLPVSHRTDARRSRLVGRCVDLLPVRWELGTTMRRVQADLLRDLGRAAMPFVELAARFDAGDPRERPRIAQVGINMHTEAGSTDEPLDVADEHWLDLDLLLHVMPAGGRVRLALSGAAELFTYDELRGLLERLCTLLAGPDPDLREALRRARRDHDDHHDERGHRPMRNPSGTTTSPIGGQQ
jgi:AMP-binding enzyme/AMP-binding enzyme C-terminal domain/Phosphopantetheine attachment site